MTNDDRGEVPRRVLRARASPNHSRRIYVTRNFAPPDVPPALQARRYPLQTEVKVMRRILFLLALVMSTGAAPRAQIVETASVADEIVTQKAWVLSDLHALDDKTSKLDTHFAVALAKAEIADAAWGLDVEWSKKLLREAYALTLPEEKSPGKSGATPARAHPPPTSETRARWAVRNRVLSVARRDGDFANELVKESANRLGAYEEHSRYSELADLSLEAGEEAEAREYLLRAMRADPTQTAFTTGILKLAARDRAAADALTLQYLELLRATPAAFSPQSASRITFNLNLLMFSPRTELGRGGQPVPPPGPAVQRAYALYVVEALTQHERVNPGSLKKFRLFLLMTWAPVKRYAPELTEAFLELERLSRKPGEDASLPQESLLETYRERREEKVRRALEDDVPDNSTINALIGEGDYDRARRLIEKLEDGPRKTQLTEKVNLREAMSLASKGDVVGARALAERLTKAVSIVQVYPELVRRCVTRKDQACATGLVYHATKQLKRADTSRPPTPSGIPASAVAGSREFDPVVSGLGSLAKSIFPVDEALGWEVLNELVAAANGSDLDAKEGWVGFDAGVFSTAAERNEPRARSFAENFKAPLRQIVSLAAVSRWKAAELAKKEQASR